MKIFKFLLLFLVLLIFFFSFSSNRIYTRDEALYYIASERFSKFKADIPAEYNDIDLYRGKQGKLYSPYALGHSALAIPFVKLFKLEKKPYFGAKIYTVIVFAIISFLMVLFCDNSYKNFTFSAVIVFISIMSSMAIAYNKTFFSEPSLILFFLALVTFLKKSDTSGGFLFPALSALSLGIIINIKLIYILLIPITALYIFFNGNYSKKKMPVIVLFLSLTFIISSVSAFYNYYRFENIFETGYMEKHPSGAEHGFITPFYLGFYGLLFSFGKSVFLYNPLLFLIFFIKGFLPENFKKIFLFSIILGLFHLIIFSKWIYWDGGNGVWGPRFLLPVIPVLFLFIIISYKNFDFKRKIFFWILTFTGFILNLPALLYDFKIFCYSEDWEKYLKSLFIPHYSPIIKSLKYLICNATEPEKTEVFSVCLPLIIFTGIILIMFVTRKKNVR